MTILKENTSALTRIFIDDLDGQYQESANRDESSIMMDYHDGNDIQHIKEKMAEMYATEITTVENTKGELVQHQVKSKPAQKAAIQNNLFEIVARGMIRKIPNNVAVLAENSEFEFTNNGSVDDTFTIDIEEARQSGDFGLMWSRLDDISVVCGSAVELLQVNNGVFQYQPMTSDKAHVVFGNKIEVDEEVFPVNQLNVDHAQCVIIQMDEDKYAAYFGRSTKYPNGRFVQYESTNWSSIPDVDPNNNDIDEYYVGDEIYNPLTYLQDTTKDFTTPEYPIITWQGTTQGIGKELLPTNTGLYESSREIDLTCSRVSMAANKGARGGWFFTNEGGVSPNQPSSLDEGISKLEAGQSVLVLTVPAANIAEAGKINDANTKYLADSWSIPSYLMSVDGSVTLPSGAALLKANEPLVKFIKKRKDINNSQMERLFQIEKALASIETGSSVGENVEQVWTLKPAEVLKTDLEKLTEAKLKQELKITDEAHTLAEVDGITVEQAQEQIDTLVVTPVANNTANRVFPA